MTANEHLPRKHSRRLAAGAATLALVAAATTGVALAADSSTPSDTPSSSTPSPSASGSATPAPDKGLGGRGPGGRPGDGRGLRHGPGIGGPMGALHGEFVVPDGDGGYQTVLVQRGTVSSVSKTTITVKSEDGFTKSYAVAADTLVNAQRDGITSIDKGADVSILAEQKSGKATATHVMDLSRLGELRGRFGGPGPDKTAPDTGSDSGSDSSSGSSTAFGI